MQSVALITSEASLKRCGQPFSALTSQWAIGSQNARKQLQKDYLPSLKVIFIIYIMYRQYV